MYRKQKRYSFPQTLDPTTHSIKGVHTFIALYKIHQNHKTKQIANNIPPQSTTLSLQCSSPKYLLCPHPLCVSAESTDIHWTLDIVHPLQEVPVSAMVPAHLQTLPYVPESSFSFPPGPYCWVHPPYTFHPQCPVETPSV